MQASKEALKMSGWTARTDADKDRAGVAIGSGIGDNCAQLLLLLMLLSSLLLLLFSCCSNVVVAVVCRQKPCPWSTKLAPINNCGNVSEQIWKSVRIYDYVLQRRPCTKKPGYWPRLGFLFGQGCGPPYSVCTTSPEFLEFFFWAYLLCEDR